MWSAAIEDRSLFDSTSPPSRTTGAYDQTDAAGFIKLNALRMRIAANWGRARPASRRLKKLPPSPSEKAPVKKPVAGRKA